MAVAPTMPEDMNERIRRACTEITPQILAEVSDYSDIFRFFDYFHTLRNYDDLVL